MSVNYVTGWYTATDSQNLCVHLQLILHCSDVLDTTETAVVAHGAQQFSRLALHRKDWLISELVNYIGFLREDKC